MVKPLLNEMQAYALTLSQFQASTENTHLQTGKALSV